MSSVLVRIPMPLRRLTGGKDKVESQETNLKELIDDLESQYPGMKERLVDEDGNLRYFVNIYLNGEDVRFLQGLDTDVKAVSYTHLTLPTILLV